MNISFVHYIEGILVSILLSMKNKNEIEKWEEMIENKARNNGKRREISIAHACLYLNMINKYKINDSNSNFCFFDL